MELMKIYGVTSNDKIQTVHIHACDSRWTSLWLTTTKCTQCEYDRAVACIHFCQIAFRCFHLDILVSIFEQMVGLTHFPQRRKEILRISTKTFVRKIFRFYGKSEDWGKPFLKPFPLTIRNSIQKYWGILSEFRQKTKISRMQIRKISVRNSKCLVR